MSQLIDASQARARTLSRNRWAALVAALALAVLNIGLSGPATAEPTGIGDASSTPKFLKLTLDSVTPNTVTTSSDAVVTIAGTVTNIGDRVVDDIEIRTQRTGAITDPRGLRSALRLDQSSYTVNTPFVDVARELNPGQRKQFTLRMGVRAASKGSASLDITAPGVYPLLLNVNGTPAYGGQARLDDARFLLPILGLPGDSDPKSTPPVSAPTEAPVATTMLWPLADRPRLVAGIPGSVNGKALLTDDELAGELATGGRLDQLLGALESAVHPDSAGTGANLANALCLAVDPDLLLTVSDMTTGYRVLASPSDPDGPTRDGTGTDAAKAWLNRLRALSSTMCTVSLPFAQVDLSALAAVHDAALTARAITSPADLVDQILSIKSVHGVSLPESGSFDADAATMLGQQGFTSAVLADNAVAPAGTAGTSSSSGSSVHTATPVSVNSSTAAPSTVRLPGPTPPAAAAPANGTSTVTADPGMKVSTFDIWPATALAAVGSNPPTPAFTPENVRYDVSKDSRTARLQDALGAMSWTALNPQPNRPRSQLLMPPQQWSANRDEASTLLTQLQTLVHSGLATPRSFQDLLAAQADSHSYEVRYSSGATTDAVPNTFIAPVQLQAGRITDLMKTLVEVPQQEPTPRTFLTPLRDDLVRSLSLSDRTSTGSQADTAAQRRLDQTTTALDGLFRSVTVLPPGGVYTLASEQSPLLLVARNELPVAARIRFKIGVPSGTDITDIGEQTLPAEGTRSFQIPTKVSDSRSLTIPISLTTPDGIALGNATSVKVRSNAYGSALAIITACAGALLFLLAGRRLWRRFRGQPDPADEGLDPGKRRRLNKYLRARSRVLQRQETP
ncbi:DUF6049 family protein [Nocardia macrotermitis]|uniref:Glycoprotein n=1 Tax=Nocardia macrotermitis TaxID=2585198 RepID=A0A7K0DAZ5_9NOCA|nr:DUF6049 family protein [Nocardia macrotermitis]MQY22965.1 hypothetical protein [Nocardia macrotermitis]